MESKKDDSKVAQFGNLISPVAIAASLLFLFMATSSLDGRDLGNELNSAIFVILSPTLHDTNFYNFSDESF